MTLSRWQNCGCRIKNADWLTYVQQLGSGKHEMMFVFRGHAGLGWQRSLEDARQ
jgi:hypothetical protein